MDELKLRWKEMTEIERRKNNEEWRQHLDMLTRFHPENVIPDALLILEDNHNNEPVPKQPAGVQQDSIVKKNLVRGRGRGKPLKEKEDEDFIARVIRETKGTSHQLSYDESGARERDVGDSSQRQRVEIVRAKLSKVVKKCNN